MAVIRSYSITSSVRGVVHVPFRCPSCALTTTGHAEAEGVGRGTSVIVRPDQEAARREAQASLQANAELAVDASPCPRCGATSEVMLARMAAYDAKYPNGQRGRRLRIFAIGVGISAAFASSCIVSMIVFPSKGSTASDMVGVALCAGGFFLVAGSAIAAVVTYVTGPGPRPTMAAGRPANVWFDPPPT